MSTPYIGFGNDTLAKQSELHAGDEIDCPKCEKRHAVEDSDPPMLLFYRCGSETFLAGVNGRSIMRAKSDVSGSLPVGPEKRELTPDQKRLLDLISELFLKGEDTSGKALAEKLGWSVRYVDQTAHELAELGLIAGDAS